MMGVNAACNSSKSAAAKLRSSADQAVVVIVRMFSAAESGHDLGKGAEIDVLAGLDAEGGGGQLTTFTFSPPGAVWSQ